ncbi:class I SAM-dependent methyltransferase [Corallococcus praedator]|uniref:Class I SAM-dependent methyltransferase n=1 Tax=Corallococcus praedator TaxID=2316724 RepID=A0ABX9QHE8_9BACT|nr:MULTISPECIES: class I SAM-dependent methyltransferase [Corallococcus]RKH18314.1 class I SAM-dependent methyltransferase [Corallococcus sp. CA047B]RKH26748.1 class I SAM-dependent methyltransferase [Corallococcus sp. CA031C]RKI05950.1 class I SAM-dependent methyltransferase [Corallococcus praedator]
MNAHVVAPLLRCIFCRREQFTQQDSALHCEGCGRRFSRNGAGYTDLMQTGTQPRTPPNTVAQRLMESDAFVGVYEHLMRPLFVRIFAGPGATVPTPQEEYAVYERWLDVPARGGPWLDLSCGAGFYTQSLARSAGNQLVVGLDLSEAMLEKAARQVNGTGNTVLLRGNVYELPLRDGVFSGVLNAGSLHLYPDPDLAYREIFRLLKPGGTYVASTFAESPRPLGRLGVSATGIRRTDLPGLPAALARAGFVDYEEQRYGDAFILKVRRPE